jgi:hypothetical protein
MSFTQRKRWTTPVARSCLSSPVQAPGGVGRLHRREQQGRIAVFDPKPLAKPVGRPRRDVGCMGTQPVVGHDTLEGRVVRTPLGHEALGRVAFTILVARAIWLDQGFWHPGNHGTLVRMDDRCAQQLMRIRDRAVALDLGQT